MGNNEKIKLLELEYNTCQQNLTEWDRRGWYTMIPFIIMIPTINFFLYYTNQNIKLILLCDFIMVLIITYLHLTFEKAKEVEYVFIKKIEKSSKNKEPFVLSRYTNGKDEFKKIPFLLYRNNWYLSIGNILVWTSILLLILFLGSIISSFDNNLFYISFGISILIMLIYQILWSKNKQTKSLQDDDKKA